MDRADILVVEDESLVAEDIRQCLLHFGYGVCGVESSGENALEKVRALRPDLVLMDIILQGKLDGIETAKKIKEDFNIPIIYLTAHADLTTLDKAKLTEPFGYIIKPFRQEELQSNIEMALYKSRMENKLKEQNEWFSTTLNSIGDAVIATDNKGCVIFMNPMAEALTGSATNEVHGLDVSEVFQIFDAETKAPLENPIKALLSQGLSNSSMVGDTLLLSRQGKRTPIDDSAALIKDNKGNINGVVLVFRDISSRKLIEEELAKTRKLKSLGTLAGGIAHDFNNSLQGIIGNLDLARMILDDKEKISEVLDKCWESAEKARRLTKQLITFAEGGKPIKRETDTGAFVRDTVNFALSGSGVKAEFESADGIWSVNVDRGQLRSVLYNIATNAGQAMDGAGIISIGIENNYIFDTNKFPLTEGNYVKISIKDNGDGIPNKIIERIFDPYFSTKKGHSGMGLATAHSIVKNHGGLITVDSELDIGTTFSIYLPATGKTVQTTQVKRQVPVHGEGAILLMDDEALVLETVSDLLIQIGYDVDAAMNGEHAVSLFQQKKARGEDYVAVILDLTIAGGMGGKETMKELLKIDPQVKAVVFSGYSNDPVMAEYEKYGFKGYSVKPFDLTEFSRMLHNVIHFGKMDAGE